MSDPNAKTKQRQTLILGGAAVGILALVGAGMVLFDNPPPKAKEKVKEVAITPPGNIGDKDAWRANEAKKQKENATKIESTESKLKSQSDQLATMKKELDQLKLQRASGSASEPRGSSPSGQSKYITSDEAAKKLLEQPLPTNGQRVLGSPNAASAGQKPGQIPAPGSVAAPPPRASIELIQFGAGQQAKGGTSGGAAPQPETLGFPVDERARKVKHRDAEGGKGIEFMPAGSFVRVFMLNGVDAPTGGQAQSNPLPIAFHVQDVANLANRYKLDIRDCRFIAAGWGDLSSERTMGRTESLTCIINDEAVEMPVKGTVIGEDGKAGIRGRVVTKQGQLLANALFAGSLSGIGNAFRAAATTTTSGGGGVTQSIDSDRVAQAAIGGGVGQAANSLAQYYLKAADKLYPVIETDGGRVVEILITKGAVYQGKASNRDSYRSMLRRGSGQERSDSDD